MTTIFSDLNVRLPQINDNDQTIITDSQAVVQSAWRLLNTDEGEVPYCRGYGINLKQFLHAPLTKETASNIYDYVKQKITMYEQRVTVLQADVDADMDRGIITMILSLRVNSTGEIVQLPTLSVPVGA